MIETKPRAGRPLRNLSKIDQNIGRMFFAMVKRNAYS